MTAKVIGKVVVVMAMASAVGFLAVAIHEFDYANSHPFAYGPAKVIAWGALSGAVLALGVALLGYLVTKKDWGDD